MPAHTWFRNSIYDALAEGFDGADLTSVGRTNNVSVRALRYATATVQLSPLAPFLTVVATDPSAPEVGQDVGTFTISRTESIWAVMAVYVSVAGTATRVDYQTI